MEPTAPRLHPLLIIAAISVTAAALAGVGVLTGIIPAPHGAPESGQVPVAATSPAAPQATPLPPQAAEASAAPAAAEPAPPVKHAARKALKAMADKHKTRVRLADRAAAPPAPLSADPNSPAPAAPPVCRECGVVESVQEVVKEGEGTGLGAVAGGLVGGVIGNQIGSGGTRDVARIAGMVGGAYAGHQIEKAQRKTVHYDIVVRMDDGTTRTVVSDVQPTWRAGDRVKISNGALVAGS